MSFFLNLAIKHFSQNKEKGKPGEKLAYVRTDSYLPNNLGTVPAQTLMSDINQAWLLSLVNFF